MVVGRRGGKCCTTEYWILNVTPELQGVSARFMTRWLFLSWWMLKVRIISPILQPCKASTNSVLEGDARAFWLCTLKRYEAVIYVELVALLSCLCCSFLSNKRTDSICWATALISEASGVTQIYFGLLRGGM